MGEKKKTESKGENKKNDNGGGKGNVSVVLKADLHFQGCASKVTKWIRSFDGVDTATIGGKGKYITVVGKVDPLKLKEKVGATIKKQKKKKESKNNSSEAQADGRIFKENESLDIKALAETLKMLADVL